MADVLTITALLLTAFMATAVVLTRDPVRQAIVLSGYGLVLAILFIVLQAPDVAMSQTGVGTVVVPLIVMLAINAIRRHHTREPDERPEPSRSGGSGEPGEPNGGGDE